MHLLCLTLSQPDDKIQLGPRAQLNWMKGSSGGAKTSDSGKYTLRNPLHFCTYYIQCGNKICSEWVV